MPPMPIPMLGEDALRDLERIASSLGTLQKIIDLFPELARAPKYSTILDLISERSGIEKSEAAELVESIIAVEAFYDATDETPARAYDLLTHGIGNSAPDEWKSKNLAAWLTSKELIVQLLEPDNPIAILSKTREVQYAYERIWLHGNIYTDVRPTFNSLGNEIKRATVTHTLAINYREDRRRAQFFIMLDDHDLKELAKLVERAITKGSAVSKTLMSWPVAGSEDQNAD